MRDLLLEALCAFVGQLIVGYVMQRRHQRAIAKMQRAHAARLRDLAGSHRVPIPGTYRSATEVLPEVAVGPGALERNLDVWTAEDRRLGRPPPPPPPPRSRYAGIKPIAYGPIPPVPPIPAIEFPAVPEMPRLFESRARLPVPGPGIDRRG